MANPSLDLFNNNNQPLTTNSTGAELGVGTLKGSFQTVFIWGTFGTATVIVQISPDDGVTWFNTGVSVTAQTMSNIDVAHRNNALRIRAQISGAGGGTSLRAELR